ncbi:putative histone acethyltransferase [Bodo saltans virus]|uniref:tRNA carboxymethyluridine synthase n=1 Tax=Bodo saltans virus TaxID=2024608 RepID=A0A2H4UV06_9VIRU|nr:putative histone acethyltransferase [Bodo saltans virus]ATZ80694.1 putative histone acethyltransferase [Bodo saltans virus]
MPNLSNFIMTDIEDIGNSMQNESCDNIQQKSEHQLYNKTNIPIHILEKMVMDIIEIENPTCESVKIMIETFKKVYKHHPSQNDVLQTYKNMCKNSNMEYDKKYEALLRKCPSRTHSGVTPVAVVMAAFPNGKPFTCAFDCKYCPQEPGQPRSYLKKEPGVARANSNNFDPILQIKSRLDTYRMNGHSIDKLEIIVLGGTFCSYEESYQYDFITKLYNAVNNYCCDNNLNTVSLTQSLQIERKLNETSSVRNIGLTIETRPDTICKRELIKFRNMGVTRVQLGVQHIDDDILKRVNRNCPTAKTIKAIRMLKNNCFKVDIHIMPDLPKPYIKGSDPDIDPSIDPKKEDIDWKYDMYKRDGKMFHEIINGEDFQADQWKIYPFSVVPWSKMEEEFKNGLHISYADELLENGVTKLDQILYDVSENIPIWIRVNRMIRDIPASYIIGGNNTANKRQCIENDMKKMGIQCKCIRCREPKNTKFNESDVKLFITSYKASNGLEYFISYENNDRKLLYGFLRLRINSVIDENEFVFDELKGCALIRELHVYGEVIPINNITTQQSCQHRGLGKLLMEEALNICKQFNYTKVAVIAGDGVKEYYRNKHGFHDGQYFLIKDI